MRLSEFEFPFDSKLIADRPIEPRDQARLLIVSRNDGTLAHHRVADLPSLLEPGDLLIVNDTKVLPVRLAGRKRPGGEARNLLLVRPDELGLADRWVVLCKGIKIGQTVELDNGAAGTAVERCADGMVMQFSCPVPVLMEKVGRMPLPPYIKREPTDQDNIWYQTIFARKAGSIAAPTAGLHFTERLLAALRRRGVGLATVTLHVGPATFRPVRTTIVENHRLGPEWADLSAETAALINATKRRGGRIVAVGTTVVRTVESAALPGGDGMVQPLTGDIDLFITPGYRFRVVDGLMTNFHLPKTTVLMLVAAFAGLERLRAAYLEAIRQRYRFYSYGDAMLIL
jgi:S-adenosylmethionine:tRNA ribosyltransferase-isomerase